MTALHIDFESRSTVDLKRTGVYVYAADPTTDLWCACYAFDDGPILTWRPGEPCPDDIAMHVLEGGTVCAHNASFEATLWARILGPRYGWPVPAGDTWRCTMVQAYAMAMPGSLEQAAPAAGLDIEKDAAGRRLMLQMARPRKADPLTWWDEPAKVERLIEYCRIDVAVERELEKRLRPLKQSELDLWHLDQVVNSRGVFVDRELAHAARRIVKTAAERLDQRIAKTTGHAVTSCSAVAQLVGWIRSKGLPVGSIAKDKIEELLGRDDLPDDVREALEIRRAAARASVAKIDALLNGTDEDGRARGLLQFHAASTGRWAGRRFQPQNIKRPELDDVDSAIEIVATGDIDLLDALYEDPLNVVADTLRGMIRAAPGRKIVAADYANIEGRVLAWLAGEDWKVKAFRAFDAGTGPDLYKVAYGRSYGIAPADVTKAQRQIGKVMELALGYQGGVGAFATMGVNYGVRLPVSEVESIRDAWRAAHPQIKRFWWDMEEAAILAIEQPGSVRKVGARIAFKKVGSFLFMQLPSKRFLAYAYPEIRPKRMPWTDANGDSVIKDSLSYMGVNSYTRKWERGFAYGGLLVENATQAVARDVLADAMPRLETAGYPIILTVHDEIVCEPAADHGSAAEMEAIMCALPEWAAGLPVAAEGFEDARYRK